MQSPIPDSELTDRLGGAVGGRRIVGLQRRPYRYATSAPLEEVEILLEGGERSSLILKDLSRKRLLGDARAAKPEFLHEPLRELESYRNILAPAGIGPRLFACSRLGEPHPWLLLEKVPGVELWQIGEFAIWEQVARWLAGFHARFLGAAERLRAANPYLLEHTASWYRAWCRRAIEAMVDSPQERAQALAPALERYGDVADSLAGLPLTLMHGEFYPSNVLVVQRDERPGVYPIDWEMAALGPGLIDLAALRVGWSDRERDALTVAYAGGLEAAGAEAPASDRLSVDLLRCHLHLALQWVGWSSDWLPPEEHAHDWLGEALTASRELGLA